MNRHRPIIEVFHIGEKVRQEVDRKRLTYKEFGGLIHRNEKTIPDIYERSDMSIDLLLSISKALNKDFFNYYYEEYEFLNKLRTDAAAFYPKELDRLTKENNALEKELAILKTELFWVKKAVELQNDNIVLLKGNMNKESKSTGEELIYYAAKTG